MSLDGRPPPDLDVIVVGAGPAGCAAARLLAPERRVLILDRATFPRPKLCGGGLSEKTIRQVDRIFGPGLLGPLALPAYSAVRICWRERPVAEIGAAGLALRFAARDEFDHRLLQAARQAGAGASLGERVLAVDSETGLVRTDRRELRAGWVLAADGVESAACRSAGLRGPFRRRHMAATMEVIQRFSAAGRARLLGPGGLPSLSFGLIPCGYGWAFPLGSRVVVGMGGLAARNRGLRRSFRSFLDLHGVGSEVPESDARGYPLAFGRPLARPGRGRLLALGEAAGFVDPVLGEGIFFALASGALAAQAILAAGRDCVPQTVVESYRRACRREILPEIRWGLRLRRLLYCRPLLPVWVGRLISRPDWGAGAFRVVAGQISYRETFFRIARRCLPGPPTRRAG